MRCGSARRGSGICVISGATSVRQTTAFVSSFAPSPLLTLLLLMMLITLSCYGRLFELLLLRCCRRSVHLRKRNTWGGMWAHGSKRRRGRAKHEISLSSHSDERTRAARAEMQEVKAEAAEAAMDEAEPKLLFQPRELSIPTSNECNHRLNGSECGRRLHKLFRG